jgi:hypothetical protein
MLRTSRDGMLKTEKGPFDITGHRNINGACIIIPSKSQAAVVSASPVSSDLVMELKNVKEMLGFFVTNISNTEVIDTQGEIHGACLMSEITRGVTSGLISMRQEALLKKFVCKDTGLR